MTEQETKELEEAIAFFERVARLLEALRTLTHTADLERDIDTAKDSQ